MEQFNIPTDLKAQFLRLYELALADGNFSPLELKMLYKFGDERNIPKDELDKILLSTTGDLEIPDTVERKIEYLFDFARMAWADGQVSEDERTSMQKFAQKFGFVEKNIEELVDYLIKAVKQGKTKNDVINELNS